ncbi:MAG: MarR family winged helix-turn-helix transcriptional regulator [Candidatus Bipolaricaulota bacterium]|nr:MarR family winged helix-turn-helix transcriptional regulator [Candidatus Bipolaricaulota bacterium]
MPKTGISELDEKLVSALERLAHVLRTLLWEEATESRLSPIQIQTLLYLNSHSEGLCRVGQLAQEFGLTPATMSDAVASLEAKGLLTRKPCPEDRRAQTLRLTAKGRRSSAKLSRWADTFYQQLEHFSPEEKTQALTFLLKLIESLYRSGIITVARICLTCRFFRPHVHSNSQTPHHCALMDKPLSKSDLRVDCPDHKLAS